MIIMIIIYFNRQSVANNLYPAMDFLKFSASQFLVHSILRLIINYFDFLCNLKIYLISLPHCLLMGYLIILHLNQLQVYSLKDYLVIPHQIQLIYLKIYVMILHQPYSLKDYLKTLHLIISLVSFPP